jgi:D-lactate dehydrogenase
MSLIEALKAVVGARNVLTGDAATRPYRKGFRFGGGEAAAVVRPQSLAAFWHALQACVTARAAIIVQAANTGLTGGSTPSGEDYDRPLVIISPVSIGGIHLIDGGRQVVCLPGATLNRLEALLAPLGREPHSVIGSSCIGASVIGGVCNNSGGALIRRGPAYTELALYAQLGPDGVLRLVNHLGVALEGDPEAMLAQVESGRFEVVAGGAPASDGDYQRRVRLIDEATPARYNADPARLFEASGCAGKLAVFAVRLDTFVREKRTQTFYIGTNDPGELTRLRRACLADLAQLPISAEYMHRDCFDMADRYGKDMFLAIRAFGTDRVPWLNRMKLWLDRLGKGVADRSLQRLAALLPDHLPKRMREFRDRFVHHLILKAADDGIAETQAVLGRLFPSASGDFFACSDDQAARAFLHRFVAAGAAIRYREVHPSQVEDVVALDFALPRNAVAWVETLPEEIERRVSHKLYYGHFFCHVFHHDYIVRQGHDAMALEHDLRHLLDSRGAEYPAEHNVGHLYPAKPTLAAQYRALDPCNIFNPGIGQLSKLAHWATPPACPTSLSDQH